MSAVVRPLQENKTNATLQVYDLGFAKDYKQVWEFQRKLVSKRIENIVSDSVIVVEHDHVLTTGRSSHIENILVKDLPIYEIERGGDVTYHGPGQLVLYPIISLEAHNLGVRQFVELLEWSIVDTVTKLGVKNAEGKLGPQTGVWIASQRKIASIGVAVSHWVTYHGLALNVNTDLSYFQKIKPCGFESSIMTKLSKELGREEVDMPMVKDMILDSLSRRLSLKPKFQ